MQITAGDLRPTKGFVGGAWVASPRRLRESESGDVVQHRILLLHYPVTLGTRLALPPSDKRPQLRVVRVGLFRRSNEIRQSPPRLRPLDEFEDSGFEIVPGRNSRPVLV